MWTALKSKVLEGTFVLSPLNMLTRAKYHLALDVNQLQRPSQGSSVLRGALDSRHASTERLKATPVLQHWDLQHEARKAK